MTFITKRLRAQCQARDDEEEGRRRHPRNDIREPYTPSIEARGGCRGCMGEEGPGAAAAGEGLVENRTPTPPPTMMGRANQVVPGPEEGGAARAEVRRV